MDRRRQPRITTSVPVRIWGVDADCRPFMEVVRATNINDDGALLEGVRCLLKPGEVVDVQYNHRKAEFVVVWAGKQGTLCEGEIGLQSVSTQPSIWDGYLDRACACVGEG